MTYNGLYAKNPIQTKPNQIVSLILAVCLHVVKWSEVNNKNPKDYYYHLLETILMNQNVVLDAALFNTQHY